VPSELWSEDVVPTLQRRSTNSHVLHVSMNPSRTTSAGHYRPDANELADLLGITRSTVYRALQRDARQQHVAAVRSSSPTSREGSSRQTRTSLSIAANSRRQAKRDDRARAERHERLARAHIQRHGDAIMPADASVRRSRLNADR
jgi:DNA-binding MarR family transcriptional regulator